MCGSCGRRCAEAVVVRDGGREKEREREAACDDDDRVPGVQALLEIEVERKRG